MEILAAGLAGLVLGSFLNVVATRVPAGESVLVPRSHCRACGIPLRLRDLAPVVSFVLLGGRCRNCGARIGWRYPVVEVAGAAIVVGAVLAPGGDGWAVRVVFFSLLLVLAVTDAERMVLPDWVTLGGLAAGIGFAAFGGAPGLLAAALGAVAGSAPLWGLRLVWLRWRRLEALGLGDVKLMAMVGAFVGPAGAVEVIGLGAGLALVVAVPLLLTGRIRRDTRLPFGVFLSVAAAARWVVAGTGLTPI